MTVQECVMAEYTYMTYACAWEKSKRILENVLHSLASQTPLQ